MISQIYEVSEAKLISTISQALDEEIHLEQIKRWLKTGESQ